MTIGFRRFLGFLSVLCCALVSVPSAVAQSGETLVGNLEFRQAKLEGQTNVTTQGLSALHVVADGSKPVAASWRLQASAAVVNWSRIRVTAVGSDPNDPNRPFTTAGSPKPSFGEERFSASTISSERASAEGNLLLLPTPGAALDVTTENDVVAEASRGEAWSVGYKDANQATYLGNHAKNLFKSHNVDAGSLVLRGKDALDGNVRGNFSLLVWGSNLTLRSDGQVHNFASGSWWENATGPGPRGTTRDEYWQFVRITLVEATFHLEHRGGTAQWTSSEAHAQTSGAVEFLGARGSVQSSKRDYVPDGTVFRIEGMISQRIDPRNDQGFFLASNVRAEQAQVVASSFVAVPATPGMSLSLLAWVLLALVIVGALAVAGRYGYAGWSRNRDWDRQLELAGRALEDHRIQRAIRSANRLVRLRARSASSWVVWGESRRAKDGPAAIIGPLEAVASQVDRPSLVQFLLTLAHVEVGNMTQARRWLAAAFKDASFVEDFETDPRLLDLRKRFGFPPRSDIVKAYA